MNKIRMTIAATVVALASALTMGLVTGSGAAVVQADQPFGCC